MVRYTPAAYELAGSMRMQAMRLAASSVDLEHLATALLTMNPTLFGSLTTQDAEHVARKLRVTTRGDQCGVVMGGGPPAMPSDALKRVITRSADEAQIGRASCRERV